MDVCQTAVYDRQWAKSPDMALSATRPPFVRQSSAIESDFNTQPASHSSCCSLALCSLHPASMDSVKLPIAPSMAEVWDPRYPLSRSHRRAAQRVCFLSLLFVVGAVVCYFFEVTVPRLDGSWVGPEGERVARKEQIRWSKEDEQLRNYTWATPDPHESLQRMVRDLTPVRSRSFAVLSLPRLISALAGATTVEGVALAHSATLDGSNGSRYRRLGSNGTAQSSACSARTQVVPTSERRTRPFRQRFAVKVSTTRCFCIICYCC